MKNDFLRLPYTFDSDKLAADLTKCLELIWPEHFNKKDYTGKWTSIALRSVSGKAQDIYAHPVEADYQDTELLQHCNYFKEIIDLFNCPKETVRLLSLAPGSKIKTHIDPREGYEFGVFRVHIPVKTNSFVSFVLNETNINMQVGECWYANFSLPHSVENNGYEARIHLVLDCIRNDWSDQLFKQAGYDFAEEARLKNRDLNSKKAIVSELVLQNAPAELIRQLQLEIEELEALENDK